MVSVEDCKTTASQTCDHVYKASSCLDRITFHTTPIQCHLQNGAFCQRRTFNIVRNQKKPLQISSYCPTRQMARIHRRFQCFSIAVWIRNISQIGKDVVIPPVIVDSRLSHNHLSVQISDLHLVEPGVISTSSSRYSFLCLSYTELVPRPETAKHMTSISEAVHLPHKEWFGM